MNSYPMEVSPAEVSARLAAGESLRLIDVREPGEHAVCRIDGARLIPMGSIPLHLQELDDDGDPLIIICHHGVRSLHVVNWLRQKGVENCSSMAGGIDLWSVMVDAGVPRY